LPRDAGCSGRKARTPSPCGKVVFSSPRLFTRGGRALREGTTDSGEEPRFSMPIAEDERPGSQPSGCPLSGISEEVIGTAAGVVYRSSDRPRAGRSGRWRGQVVEVGGMWNSPPKPACRGRRDGKHPPYRDGHRGVELGRQLAPEACMQVMDSGGQRICSPKLSLWSVPIAFGSPRGTVKQSAGSDPVSPETGS
jgi:hypothetical protein